MIPHQVQRYVEFTLHPQHETSCDSVKQTVATSPVALRWVCDSPQTGYAWRITPLCMWREQAIIEWSRWNDLGEWPLIMLVNLVNSWLCLLTVTTRGISSGDLCCCLLPRCEALHTCRSGFPIATKQRKKSKVNSENKLEICREPH